MRNIEKFFLTSLLVGGCLAPPTEVVGARKPAAVIETPAPEPTPDAVFLDEIKEIQLRGGRDAVLQSQSALYLLREKANSLYTGLVLRYLKGVTVELLEESGKTGVWISEPFVVEVYLESRRDTKWLASTFGHESCHIRQYYRYKEEHPGEPVRVDLIGGSEKESEKECGGVTYDILKLVGADQAILDYVKSHLDTL